MMTSHSDARAPGGSSGIIDEQQRKGKSKRRRAGQKLVREWREWSRKEAQSSRLYDCVKATIGDLSSRALRLLQLNGVTSDECQVTRKEYHFGKTHRWLGLQLSGLVT